MSVVEPAPASARVPEALAAVRPREWAHVVIRTADPDRLMDWYCTVLNAQVVLKHRMINFITWDESQDRMAFIPDPQPPVAGRVDHYAVTYGSPTELAANYRRLTALGIVPKSAVNHGVASSFYYIDPDGNQLETSVENFEDAAAMNAWLATGDFDANPYGVPMPADDLVVQLEAVAPTERLAPHDTHRTWLRDAMRPKSQPPETPRRNG